MEQKVKVPIRKVRRLTELAFPEYTGRKVSVVFTDTVRFYDLNWSGGTRSEYRFVHANGFVPDTSAMNLIAPWSNLSEGARYDLAPNVVVIQHSIFCGHDMGLTIYASPIYAPRWLPA